MGMLWTEKSMSSQFGSDICQAVAIKNNASLLYTLLTFYFYGFSNQEEGAFRSSRLGPRINWPLGKREMTWTRPIFKSMIGLVTSHQFV